MHTVELDFFEDDTNGEWGISHKNSIDRGFNAFWNGIGIFHDVFEHWFEGIHKNFRGDYAFNVAGEVAAMGACYYYTDVLGVHNRRLESYKGWDNSLIDTTFSYIEESAIDGYKPLLAVVRSNLQGIFNL